MPRRVCGEHAGSGSWSNYEGSRDAAHPRGPRDPWFPLLLGSYADLTVGHPFLKSELEMNLIDVLTFECYGSSP